MHRTTPPSTPLASQDAAQSKHRPSLGKMFVDRVIHGPADPDAASNLRKELELAQRRKAAQTRARRVLLAIAGIFLLLCIYSLFSDDASAARNWLLAAVFATMVALVMSPTETSQRIQELKLELEIADTDPSPERAYQLFRHHQMEIRRYYNLALRHSRVMLLAGLFCVLIGLGAVVGAGLVFVQAWDKVSELDKFGQTMVAVLGAVGGILSNYVAAIYLKMYAATSETLNEFHGRLVLTHHLHFANYLASKVTSHNELPDQTFKTMAEELSKQS